MNNKYNIFAADIDAVKMTQFLQDHRRDLGSTADRLCDVFGVHILIADYEIRIPNGSPGAEMTREAFLTFMTQTKFQTQDSSAVPAGKSICVHHQALKMHCLVRIAMSGNNLVFYHKSDRDDIERFIIAHAYPTETGYHEAFVLKDQPHDISALNLALGYVNFSGMTGSTLVPEKHPHYDDQMVDRLASGYVP